MNKRVHIFIYIYYIIYVFNQWNDHHDYLFVEFYVPLIDKIIISTNADTRKYEFL